MRKQKNITLWGQGGVALADILANSVAVILILIVVTLSVQQEKADLELEKNADVTTLLARQIATTVVYNDLPSSPPALLHDYHSCAIPHDCNPALYPIIELRQDYIREYNTGLKFYRKELLKPENPFDNLIKTFTPQERAGIRIDVYDVNLYYLAIGILKEHKISPRHWHYLGEDVKSKISPAQALADGKHGTADTEQESLAHGGKLDSQSQGGGEKESQNNSSTLESTQMADLESLEQIQHNDLLPPTDESGNSNGDGNSDKGSPDGSDGQQDQQGQQGNNKQQGDSEQQGQSQVQPETMFESLIDLLENEGVLSQQQGQGKSQQQGQSQRQKGRRSMRMHVPNASSFAPQQQQDPPQKLLLDKEDYNRVLLAFFLDQLQLARTQKTTFIEGLNEILSRYAQDPDILKNHPDIALIDELDRQLNQYFIEKPQNPAPLKKIIGKHPNQLNLIANQVNATSTLLINQENDEWSKNLSDKNNGINLILRSFPGLYKGERLDLPPGHLLLVHPNEARYPEMQWRPIIIVDTWLEDASVGFIKAAFTDNTLYLDSQILGTRINNILIPEPKLTENLESKRIATTLYAGIGLILFLLFAAGLTISLSLRKKAIS
jgi:hypothetical protein